MEKSLKQNKLLNLSAIFLSNLNSIDLVIKSKALDTYNVSYEFLEVVQVLGNYTRPILFGNLGYVFRLHQLRWQAQSHVGAILFVMFFVPAG